MPNRLEYVPGNRDPKAPTVVVPADLTDEDWAAIRAEFGDANYYQVPRPADAFGSVHPTMRFLETARLNGHAGRFVIVSRCTNPGLLQIAVNGLGRANVRRSEPLTTRFDTACIADGTVAFNTPTPARSGRVRVPTQLHTTTRAAVAARAAVNPRTA